MIVRDPLADPAPLIKRVYAYVAYRIGPGPDAEDVTSDVFERALRYRASYDVAKGQAISWLIGIARRCVDESMSGRPSSHGVELADSLVGLEDLEHDTLERLTIAAAVSRLEERDRELIALRYGADLSARQIAETLELKTNAVEVALHRARERLRSELELHEESDRVLPTSTRSASATLP